MSISGFDASKWQSGRYAGGGGFDFAFWKAAEGVGYVDPTYYDGIASIRRAGLVPGAYTFNRPDLGNTPEAEADWLLAVVGDPTGMLLAPDLEVAYGGPLLNYRARFLARLAQRCNGYRAPWYSYWNYVVTHALNTADTTWCWLAWPDENGPFPGLLVPIRIQQYGLTSVPGIVGGVDANRFFGTRAELAALVVGGAPTATPAVPIGGGEGSMVTITGADERIHRLAVTQAHDGQGAPILDGEGSRGGPVTWAAFTGGPGGLDGWAGSDSELPGGGGWIAAGTLAATLWTWPDAPGGARELLVVQGRGMDGQVWRKALYTNDYSVQADWAPIAGPLVAVPGSASTPGPAGPPGPSGAVDDAHITKVALKAVNDVTKAP